MSDHARGGWLMPVLLAVATSAAITLATLYVLRPNAGELGAIRVVADDDGGKPGSTVHVVVAEAPFVQKDTVSPGPSFTGVVHYPVPYQLKPNLKVTCGKRQYEVSAETETGFSWVAQALPDDFKEEAKKEEGWLEKALGLSLATASASGKLKPGLVFEGFTWEAKGLRASPGSRPFEQKGTFQTTVGQEGVVTFPLPYDEPPNVEFDTQSAAAATLTTEITARQFKWRNSGTSSVFHTGPVKWTSRGVRTAKEK